MSQYFAGYNRLVKSNKNTRVLWIGDAANKVALSKAVSQAELSQEYQQNMLVEIEENVALIDEIRQEQKYVDAFLMRMDRQYGDSILPTLPWSKHVKKQKTHGARDLEGMERHLRSFATQDLATPIMDAPEFIQAQKQRAEALKQRVEDFPTYFTEPTQDPFLHGTGQDNANKFALERQSLNALQAFDAKVEQWNAESNELDNDLQDYKSTLASVILDFSSDFRIIYDAESAANKMFSPPPSHGIY